MLMYSKAGRKEKSDESFGIRDLFGCSALFRNEDGDLVASEAQERQIAGAAERESFAMRQLTSSRSLAFALGVTLHANTASARPSHADEIAAYASLTAMAQTASDRCADILVSNDMIAKAPSFFHLTPEDESATRLAYGLEMKRLGATIDGAPSLKAWCDAAYRAYGPKGDVVKGLMAR